MSLGTLTENGIVMNHSPILIEEKDGSIIGFLKKPHRNEKITSLIELTKSLKKLDNVKNKKMNVKAFNEREKLLSDVILIIKDNDKGLEKLQFKYVDELDLIRS